MHRTERSPWSLALWISTVALASMPLLGMRPMVFVIIVWLILALFVRMRSANPTMVDRTALIVLSVPFLLIVLDLLRADSIASGWPFVERSAALVVFPIGFLLLGAPTDARTRSWFTTVFTLSGTVLAVVVNALMLPYLSEAWEIDAPFSSTYRYELADISGVHPPYAAYWFLVGALFQLDVLLGAFNKWRPLRSLLWRTASVIILVVTALFIGSRMPLFAFGAGVVVLLFMRLPRAVAVRLWNARSTSPQPLLLHGQAQLACTSLRRSITLRASSSRLMLGSGSSALMKCTNFQISSTLDLHFVRRIHRVGAAQQQAALLLQLIVKHLEHDAIVLGDHDVRLAVADGLPVLHVLAGHP
jgi:hypothetical protein